MFYFHIVYWIFMISFIFLFLFPLLNSTHKIINIHSYMYRIIIYVNAYRYSVFPKKGDEGKLYYFYITLKSRTWTWATTVLYLSTAHNNSEHSEATHRSILNAMEKFTTNDIHNTIHASIFLLIPNSQQSLSASNWLSVSAYTCQYVVFQK